MPVLWSGIRALESATDKLIVQNRSPAQLVTTVAEHHFNAGDALGLLAGALLSGFLAWSLWRGEHIQVIKVRTNVSGSALTLSQRARECAEG